jgi:hypothetical protein
MGLFKKFKRKHKFERKSAFDGNYDIDMNNWFQVFSACLGKMMAIQNACSKYVVRNQNWNVDFKKGIIAFGNDEYPIQFIGSEATSSNSWLWGWENINNFQDSMIELTNSIKEIGKKWNLEPLITAEFELTDVFNGHNLSIVTCGLKDNYCYYRGAHKGGAIFVAFSDVPASVFEPVDLQQFVNITMQCIQQWNVDHKVFIESFLLWNGINYKWSENNLIASFKSDLIVEYEQVDGVFRIKKMNSK